MKLNYYKVGEKFFFVTICVVGRRKLLASLIDEKSRPELKKFGEIVKLGLRALHLYREAIGISDYVIMPDHFHFILRIDHERERFASPLYIAHRLMDAIEIAAQGELDGDRGVPAPLDIEKMARLLKSSERGAGQGPVKLPIFDRSCYIELSFDPRQLKEIRRYIRLNPARALWKARHPEMFVRRGNIRHPRLDETLLWTAMGDMTLIASPFLFRVKLTSKKSLEELAPEIEEAVRKASCGWVAMSGFISPAEREVLRRIKALPRTKWIKAVPYSLPLSFDPSTEDSRYLACGRELLLSSFPETETYGKVTRVNCVLMNDRLEKIATAAL